MDVIVCIGDDQTGVDFTNEAIAAEGPVAGVRRVTVPENFGR